MIPLRQAGPTACGPAVALVTAALVSGAGPDAVADRFSGQQRFAAAQRRVHRRANRLWPRALGTTPFGMRAWLRRHAPAAGGHRIRWTCGAAPRAVLDAVGVAAAAGRPVPLVVGSRIPRHWVLVTAVRDGRWRVYEPSSGEVRDLDPGALRAGTAAPIVAWPRLHAVLLPRAARPRRRRRDRPEPAGSAPAGRGPRRGTGPGGPEIPVGPGS